MRRPAPAAGIAMGLGLCSLAALVRAGLAGELPVSEGPGSFASEAWYAFALGMTLACVCYVWALWRAQGPLGRRQLAAALGIHLCAAVAPPLTSNDAFMNLACGKLALAGYNPYLHAPSELPADSEFARVDWPSARSAWGPVATYVSAWAAARGGRAQAFLAFKVALLIASLGCVFLAYRVCRGLPAAESGRAFSMFAYNPLLAWELTGQAHNDALMLLPLLGFVLCSAQGRAVAAVGLLALAAAAKFAAAPALALYLCALARVSWRRCLLAAALAAAVTGASWLPFWDGPRTLLGAAPLLRGGPSHIQNSFASWFQFAAVRADNPLVLEGWLAVSRLMLVVAAVFAALRSTTPERAIQGTLCFLMLSLAVGLPYVHPWYWTWLLPLALGPVSPARRLGVALYTALAPALYLTHVAGALAILVVHSAGLLLLLAPGPLAEAVPGTDASA